MTDVGNQSPFSHMMSFIQRLEENKIWYHLLHTREDALLVEVYVPGEHWEVEFFPDGNIEVEVFRSDGEIRDQEALEGLFE